MARTSTAVLAALLAVAPLAAGAITYELPPPLRFAR